MSIQAKGRFVVVVQADGTSTSLSLNLTDIPVYPNNIVPGFFGNTSSQPICDLSRALGIALKSVAATDSGTNIADTILSYSLTRHTLAITFSTAPASGEYGILFDLLF